MEDANDREDVSTVMTKVLAHLERVVEHVRRQTRLQITIS